MTAWVDTHCHLDAPEFAADAAAVRERAARAGVVHCVLPAVAAAHFPAVREQAWQGGDSYALGIHPLFTGTATDEDLATLDQFCVSRADRALLAGEISGNVGKVLITQVGQHAGHFQHLTLAVLDFVQLFEQVFVPLPSQLREVWRHAIAVGTVTSATYSGFCLTGSSIAHKSSACGLGNTGDAQGQQQTHE